METYLYCKWKVSTKLSLTAPASMSQRSPDQGIGAEPCHLPTKGDFLQTGRLTDWERYHDRRIHTARQDCDS